MHVAKLFMAFLFKSASKSAFLLLQQYFAKNFKQATVYISHEVPLPEVSGHPKYNWKNWWPALLRG